MISSFPFTFGAYTLQSEIGRGGFAVVYVAHHKPSDEFRALKVLDRRFHDQRFIEQFHQEYETLKKLKHPRIVPVLDFGEHKGDVFIGMQWVQGFDLKTRIRNSGALPLAAALAILAQVAEALDHVHNSRFVHRDVKSSNILLDAEVQAYLSDFGLMRAAERTISISQMTQSGNFLQGTVEYMSPERANGQEASPRSDVYSLAIVAYEMLTGELPFTADQPLVVLKMHTDSPPPNPMLKRPDLPAALAAELLTALAKRPTERHSSAGGFATALQSALSAEEQVTAQTSLRLRQAREGVVMQSRSRLEALERQAAESERLKKLADMQAKRFDDEAVETEKLLRDLTEQERSVQAKVDELEKSRREAEARATSAQNRLKKVERQLKTFEKKDVSDVNPVSVIDSSDKLHKNIGSVLSASRLYMVETEKSLGKESNYLFIGVLGILSIVGTVISLVLNIRLIAVGINDYISWGVILTMFLGLVGTVMMWMAGTVGTVMCTLGIIVISIIVAIYFFNRS